jgi:hypothetical protein
MSWNWPDVVRIAIAALLFGAAIWANVSGSSVSQLRGAWVSQAIR